MANCPICGKPATEVAKPFCSKRCADIDLNRWLKGSYVIPGTQDDPPTPSKPSENDPGED